MSKPIFSAAAAVTVDRVIGAPRQALQRHRCEPEPGLRIIAGRFLYSAAWLDQAARTLTTSDADARSAHRPAARLGG